MLTTTQGSIHEHPEDKEGQDVIEGRVVGPRRAATPFSRFWEAADDYARGLGNTAGLDYNQARVAWSKAVTVIERQAAA